MNRKHSLRNLCAFSIATLLLSLGSCKLILRISGYYKPPHEETRESIIDYSKKHGGRYDALYCLRSEKSFNELLKVTRNVPAVRIYDNHNRLNYSVSGKNCPWATVAAIDSAGSKYIPGEDTSFAKMMDCLQPADGDKELVKRRDYDYVLVYVWAKFSPKLSKEMLKNIGQLSTNKSGKRIKVVSVNIDLLKDYNLKRE